MQWRSSRQEHVLDFEERENKLLSPPPEGISSPEYKKRFVEDCAAERGGSYQSRSLLDERVCFDGYLKG